MVLNMGEHFCIDSVQFISLRAQDMFVLVLLTFIFLFTAIEDKYKDWKEFLVKRLTGARTLPSNFYSKVHDSLKSRFR